MVGGAVLVVGGDIGGGGGGKVGCSWEGRVGMGLGGGRRG